MSTRLYLSRRLPSFLLLPSPCFIAQVWAWGHWRNPQPFLNPCPRRSPAVPPAFHFWWWESVKVHARGLLDPSSESTEIQLLIPEFGNPPALNEYHPKLKHSIYLLPTTCTLHPSHHNLTALLINYFILIFSSHSYWLTLIFKSNQSKLIKTTSKL